MSKKQIALIADAFPPMRSSAAVQLKDLAVEFVKQNFEVTVILPDSDIQKSFEINDVEGVQVCRLKTFRTRGVPLFLRGINEAISPFLMILRFKQSHLSKQKWDGIIWYSPSIFFGVFVAYLKRLSSCKTYLILRDIFPEWALNLGLMQKGVVYYFFKIIENYQYSLADSIGIQSHSNLRYFQSEGKVNLSKIEVLQNWLSEAEAYKCSIDLSKTILANRTIFIYAGNMGAAQGVDVFLELAQSLEGRADVGILLIGRGSEMIRLRNVVKARSLDNILLLDEIDYSEIPGLYKQCNAGIVVLDSRHKTHNIPGKFLSYMFAGLPVLAKVNPGNDLINLIEMNNVGYGFSEDSAIKMKELLEKLLFDLEDGKAETFKSNAKKLSRDLFSTSTAVKQISSALI